MCGANLSSRVDLSARSLFILRVPNVALSFEMYVGHVAASLLVSVTAVVDFDDGTPLNNETLHTNWTK